MTQGNCTESCLLGAGVRRRRGAWLLGRAVRVGLVQGTRRVLVQIGARVHHAGRHARHVHALLLLVHLLHLVLLLPANARH